MLVHDQQRAYYILPTLYKQMIQRPLQTSLGYGWITSAVGVVASVICALLIDKVGRRRWYVTAFLLAIVPLSGFALLGATSATEVLILATAAYAILQTITLLPRRLSTSAVGRFHALRHDALEVLRGDRVEQRLAVPRTKGCFRRCYGPSAIESCHSQTTPRRPVLGRSSPNHRSAHHRQLSWHMRQARARE